MEKLYEIGSTLSARVDMRELVQTITDATRELAGAEVGAYFSAVREPVEAFELFAISGAPRERFAVFPKPRNTA